MTMRRRRFRRIFRGRSRPRTQWYPIEPSASFNNPAGAAHWFELDTNVPNFQFTPYTVLRVVMATNAVPFGAVANSGGSWSAGLIVLPHDEVATFPALANPPDPNFPDREFMQWHHRDFTRLANYSGDLAMPLDWDVRQRRKVRETDRLILIMKNNPGTLTPLDFGVSGRILLAYP